MGLMDRDYMHERNRQRPFSPPPERFGTLSKIVIFVAILVLLYLAADWKLNQRAAGKIATPSPTEVEPVKRPSTTSTRPPQPSTPERSPPDIPQVTGNTRTVTKCVVNGKTSYGDGECGRGAVASQVTTRTDHNLMDAVRPTVSSRQETTIVNETVVTHNTNPANDSKSECGYLDQQIKNLDSMARQPQTGQMQDWITGERKKLRDRQFRIPCR